MMTANYGDFFRDPTLIYNKLEDVERFIHFFLNKIKDMDLLMIIISIEEEKTKKIIPILSQLSL